jgi:hypothetical protein
MEVGATSANEINAGRIKISNRFIRRSPARLRGS